MAASSRAISRRCRGRLCALFALCALVGGAPAGVARADVSDDASRLVHMWSLAGARVARHPPMFLEHGRGRLLTLRPPVESAASASRPVPTDARAGGQHARGCLTVAFLAASTIEFTVETDLEARGHEALDALLQQLRGPDADAERLLRSVAGAAALTRCGPDKEQLRHVLLDVTSARAAIEIVVAASDGPLEPIEAVFPERVFGPVAPRGDPGRPIEPGPLDVRMARAERRARVEGAQHVIQLDLRASPGGTGQFAVKLSEGCHRLDLLAEVAGAMPRRATDLDAEAREASSGRVLDRDRADAPDARLDFCLGEATVVEVPFLGAAGAVTVVLSDATWPIAVTVPGHLGARARGGFASALHRRRAPPPRGQVLVDAVGVQGEAFVPVAIEPGRCYFAALALMRGEARALRLAAEVGDRAGRDDAVEQSESAGVAFCSEVEERALLRVTARGSSAWWALAVWPMD